MYKLKIQNVFHIILVIVIIMYSSGCSNSTAEEIQSSPGQNISVFRKSIHGFGCIDLPEENLFLESYGGSVEVSGWVIDPDHGIRDVLIYLDDTFLGKAEYGRTRGDVKHAYENINPNFTLKSGYQYQIDLKKIKSGKHKITVQGIANDNSLVNVGSRSFRLMKEFAFLAGSVWTIFLLVSPIVALFSPRVSSWMKNRKISRKPV